MPKLGLSNWFPGIRSRRGDGGGAVEEELAEALHGEDVERSLAGLDEVGEPRHRLVRLLALQDVQQEVGVPGAQFN